MALPWILPTSPVMIPKEIAESFVGDDCTHTMWGPRSIAKLVQITPITNNYGLWYANNYS